MTAHSAIHAAVILTALTSGTPSAFAQEKHLASLSVSELKQVFLSCDRAATQALASTADAVYCSFAFERLKREGFGGDFSRLLAWWHSEKLTGSPRVRQP